MKPDPRTAALADLCQAITALAPHLHSSDELGALARLKSELGRLSRPAPQTPPGLHDFDPTRFQRLIDLAGPAMAGTLLVHLADDLARCQTMVIAGSAEPDLGWAALRESSHILISLAGSVGAASLQGSAERLNTAAQAQDAAAAATLLPCLKAELAALIALVRATLPAEAGQP